MSRYEIFDRSVLQLKSVRERGHDLEVNGCRKLERPTESCKDADFEALVERIRFARGNECPVILMMGGHPIKLGLSRFLIDLVEKRFVTHVATNGAGVIHDFELALFGATSEDVSKWIQQGQFGLWEETSRLNDVIRKGNDRGEGLGEAVGRYVEDGHFPFGETSLAAACWRPGVPFTCHVGIGSDIIHCMANCDARALGEASYRDFLIFARTVQDLEGGVYLNIGTAVTGPEVYLKALSMARNVARQAGQDIKNFTAAVFDLTPLPREWQQGEPEKHDPMYYWRPWKTILIRTVADGGTSYYFNADHRQSIPALWDALVNGARKNG